jgi:hypothetical protein
MRRVAQALLAGTLIAAPRALVGQRLWQWEVGLTGVGMRVHSYSGPTVQELSGAVFGGQGQLVFARWITLDLAYMQGILTPSAGQAADRDVVEGYAQIGARPLSWVTLRLGPHAWTYVSNAGTQRWFLMEGRARVQGEILPEIQSYLELWRVFSANVNVPQPFQTGMGGEGGISLRIRDVPIIPERFPVRIRLGYSIERVRMEGGNPVSVRKEIVDRLSLSIGIEQR